MHTKRKFHKKNIKGTPNNKKTKNNGNIQKQNKNQSRQIKNKKNSKPFTKNSRSDFYTQAISLLFSFFHEHKSLYSLIYQNSVLNKKAIYAVLIQTLKHKNILDEILVKKLCLLSHCEQLFKNHYPLIHQTEIIKYLYESLLIFGHDLLFGKGLPSHLSLYNPKYKIISKSLNIIKKNQKDIKNELEAVLQIQEKEKIEKFHFDKKDIISKPSITVKPHDINKIETDDIINGEPNNLKTFILPPSNTDIYSQIHHYHPIYCRINYIIATKEMIKAHLKDLGYHLITYDEMIKLCQQYQDNTNSVIKNKKNKSTEKKYSFDIHFPFLVLFPCFSASFLFSSPLITQNYLIHQEKASCLPVYLLSFHHCIHKQSIIIDTCASPGNKTHQLACLLSQIITLNPSSISPSISPHTIHALDISKKRYQNLVKRLKVWNLLDPKSDMSDSLCTLTDTNNKVTVTAHHQDFLKINSLSTLYQQAEVLVIDPSCTGSGVTQIDQIFSNHSPSPEKIASLSNLQVSILTHAFQFPNVKYIIYSTCSTLIQENEEVINRIYPLSQQHGFNLIPLSPLSTIPENPNDKSILFGSRAIHLVDHPLIISKSCLRIDPQIDQTVGFFVALFGKMDITSTPFVPFSQ